MEMHQIRYFLAVCQTLNFTQAAARCGISQPSLTRAIKGLEDELGGVLFRRERRQTHLTDLGRLMKPHVEQILTASESAQAQAEAYWEPEKVELNLGVMCTVGVHPLIGFLNQIHRDLPALDISLRDAPGGELIDALISGELDVAFIGMPNYPDGLAAQALYEERYVITFAKGHAFEKMATVPMQALDGVDYLWRSNCELGTSFREFTGEDEPFELNVRFRSEREDWIQALILCGMGCAIMPEYLQKQPGIATRLLVDPPAHRVVSIVRRADQADTATTQSFTDAALAHNWNTALEHADTRSSPKD